MKIKKIANNTYLLSLRSGEKIISSLKTFYQQHSVNKFCSISGIGTIKELTLGIAYQNEEDHIDYKYLTYQDTFEIVSLLGNISVNNEDKPIVHIHISVSDEENRMIGGHLDEAEISILSEIVVTVYDVEVERIFDEDLGLLVI